MSEIRDSSKLLGIVIGLLSLFLLLRLLPLMKFLWLPITIVVFLFLVWWVYRYWQLRKARQLFDKTTEGQIRKRLKYSQIQLQRNQEAIKEIEVNLKDLEEKLANDRDLIPKNQAESERIVAGFRSELKLRYTRTAFFQTCIRKLNRLLKNHEWSRQLAEKQKELKALRENNYEELAQMEELRSEVEMDVLYLDTIEQLSRRMEATTSFDDADHLRRELEKMTQELDEL
ncbi:MAG: hypothetical protein DHS20C18_18910 [Saprospiraceae bacterium]|nr:MAG: hypothetical protein DHS20C18_18910 [Saprospiraceae bacterium]